MLKKLFKHDMRSVANIIFSLSLLVLGTTLVGTISSKISIEIGAHYYNTNSISIARTILQGILGLLTGISATSIVAFSVIVMFILMSRFYKNFFTDEGYLTFTLPVKTSSLIFSKLWSTIIWAVYDSAVVIICMLIFVSFGTAGPGQFFNDDIFIEMADMLRSLFGMFNASAFLLTIEILAAFFAASVSSVFILFLSITIGSIIAKRHKILASIGFYYIIKNVISAIAVTSFFIYFLLIFNEEMTSSFTNVSMHLFVIFIMLFYAVVAVVEYLVCHNLIKNKLNLA